MKRNYYLGVNKILIVLGLLTLFTKCSSQKKTYPELETQDIDNAGMNHGTFLTPLGCLLGHPWQFDKSQYVEYFLDDTKFGGNEFEPTIVQKNVVFEFQREGTLKFWFKTDYIKAQDDTVVLADGSTSYSHTIISSKDLLKNNWLNKIYSQGLWEVNFNDSVIKIDFGKNDFGLNVINAKLSDLTNDRMSLEQISFQDSTYNGRRIRLKKINLLC